YCLSFPRATENIQWGDDLCFKVDKKIFTVVSLSAVPQGLCFKCSPEAFAELCEREGIGPAPYVGRYKWVYVERINLLPDVELRDLVRASYEMVSAKNKSKTGRKKSTAKRKKKKAEGH